ncbi:unnamed protein product, partial [Musa acuminata var. zebrina]
LSLSPLPHARTVVSLRLGGIPVSLVLSLLPSAFAFLENIKEKASRERGRERERKTKAEKRTRKRNRGDRLESSKLRAQGGVRSLRKRRDGLTRVSSCSLRLLPECGL